MILYYLKVIKNPKSRMRWISSFD